MQRSDITELHYITPIANLPSIQSLGVLSHAIAESVVHRSIAMESIQDRRKNKQVPGAKMLHDYVNLYFDAHNPMLSACRSRNSEICVLQICLDVLDVEGVVVADRNAASSSVRFSSVNEGLLLLDKERVFASSWMHPDDPLEQDRHKLEKCAEVLVPERVHPRYVLGAYVYGEAVLVQVLQLQLGLNVTVNSGIFF